MIKKLQYTIIVYTNISSKSGRHRKCYKKQLILLKMLTLTIQLIFLGGGEREEPQVNYLCRLKTRVSTRTLDNSHL